MPEIRLADVPSHAVVEDLKRTGLDHALCAHCGEPAPGDQVRVTFTWGPDLATPRPTWGDVYTHPVDECFQPVVNHTKGD